MTNHLLAVLLFCCTTAVLHLPAHAPIGHHMIISQDPDLENEPFFDDDEDEGDEDGEHDDEDDLDDLDFEQAYDEIMTMVKQRDPALHALLLKAPQQDDEGTSIIEIVVEHMHWILEDEQPRQIDAGLAVARHELRLYIAGQAAGEPDRDTIKAILGDLFDAKLAARQLEIELISAELAEAKAQVTKARAKRDAIIARRLTEILDEDEGADVFDW